MHRVLCPDWVIAVLCMCFAHLLACFDVLIPRCPPVLQHLVGIVSVAGFKIAKQQFQMVCAVSVGSPLPIVLRKKKAFAMEHGNR